MLPCQICVHGPGIKGRADHAFSATQEAGISAKVGLGRTLISKLGSEGLLCICLKDEWKEYSSAGNTFLVNTNKIRINNNQQLAVGNWPLKKADSNQCGTREW